MDLPKDKVNNLITTTVNQIEGEVEAKAKYTLFISHSQRDRFLSDFFYNYLKHLGFNGDLRNLDQCEIFYSTSGVNTNNQEALSDTIKNFLISASNNVLILTSPNFRKSEFCMFEGGAIWATKAVTDCKIVAIDYSQIPAFLNNQSPEVSFSSTDVTSFELTREKYNEIIDVLSKLIFHLNQNRVFNGGTQAPIPQYVNFPDDVELQKQGKQISDYMDNDIIEYWETYVLNNVQKYVDENTQNSQECVVQT